MQPKRTDPYYQAQAILARRDHAEYELRQKLQRKKFSPTVIDEVVARLIREHLVDDRNFTERFIQSTLSFKAVGPRWLKAKLRSRGVATDVIDELVAQVTDETWHTLATQAAEAWARRQPGNVNREKLMRFLLARGFSYPDCQAACAAVSSGEDT